ncbi:hypothetical protein [Parashewanella curva]|nr:hypothetical protein [Parashewanella curva]
MGIGIPALPLGQLDKLSQACEAVYNQLPSASTAVSASISSRLKVF